MEWALLVFVGYVAWRVIRVRARRRDQTPPTVRRLDDYREKRRW